MHTFTALYDTQAEAEAAQAKLEQLGIIDIDHGLHGEDTAGFEGDAGAVYGEDRHIYKEATKRGGFLLTVNTDDAQADRVHQFLESTNPVDLEERERQLKAAGFVPPTAPVAASASIPTATARADEQVIPIVEEQLSVGKRQVDRGSVRVRAYTVATPVREAVQLREEHVDIERRPVSQAVSNADGLFQERSLEMTETAEEAVVGKQARVVEEVLVRKDASERVETVQDTVRHTEVDVERTDGRGVERP